MTNKPHHVEIDMVPVEDEAGRTIYAPGAPASLMRPSATADIDAYLRGAADGLKAGMGIAALLGVAVWFLADNPKPKRGKK